MKSSGTLYWPSPNTAADNSSGFSGLPGGLRYDDGSYLDIGSYGYWWSSSQTTTTSAWYRPLNYVNGDVYRLNDGKQVGFSVRCLRD